MLPLPLVAAPWKTPFTDMPTRLLASILATGGALVLSQRDDGSALPYVAAGTALALAVIATTIVSAEFSATVVITAAMAALAEQLLAANYHPILAMAVFVIGMHANAAIFTSDSRSLRQLTAAIPCAVGAALVVYRYRAGTPELLAASGLAAGILASIPTLFASGTREPVTQPLHAEDTAP